MANVTVDVFQPIPHLLVGIRQCYKNSFYKLRAQPPNLPLKAHARSSSFENSCSPYLFQMDLNSAHSLLLPLNVGGGALVNLELGISVGSWKFVPVLPELEEADDDS